MNSAKLTILFTESSRNFGGQERRLLAEAGLLIERGHRVEIACPEESALFERAFSAGVPVHPVPMRASLWPPALVSLLALLIRLKPDVIYSHSGHDSWLGGIAGIITGTPLVRCRALLTPVRSRTAYILPRRVLACSKAVKAQLVMAGVPDGKIAVHYPHIDTARFAGVDEASRAAVRRELGIDEHFPVVFCASEFRPEKRQEDLVLALEILLAESPSALLVLAGSGRKLETVRSLARSKNLEWHVRFLGEREDIPALLSAADIYAFPSDMEPFGKAPIEAMAAGVPVIACKIDGLAEFIEDGKNGIFVPPRDPRALAAAIARLARDEALRKSLAAAGRKRAACFDSRAAAEQLAGHFYAVIKGEKTHGCVGSCKKA